MASYVHVDSFSNMAGRGLDPMVWSIVAARVKKRTYIMAGADPEIE